MNSSLAWSWAEQKSWKTLLPFQRLAFCCYGTSWWLLNVCFWSLISLLLRHTLSTQPFPSLPLFCSNIFINVCSFVQACDGCFDLIFICFYFHASQSLLPDYQRLLSAMPSRRLNTSKLIENSGEFLNLIVFNNFGETLVLVIYCTTCLVNRGFSSFFTLL